MLDVAGVASLSPCTPQPPNVTLCPSPAHTQSTRTPPRASSSSPAPEVGTPSWGPPAARVAGGSREGRGKSPES